MGDTANTNASLKERGDKVFMNTYARYPIAMMEGQGCTITDCDGKKYYDFLAGIAVNALGYNHPAVTEAINRQAGKYLHVSNLFYMEPQIELAEMILANSFGDRVFLCNSGAEANEAAIKLARLASPEGKYGVITLGGSFHGRTLATLAATGQPKFHKGFEPLPAGFSYAPFGDLAALAAMIDETTCAILCEPLQGEGGVRPLAPEYIKGLREICDKHNLLLIFDEIQTGLGRTGTLFAYQQLGVTPDILTMAKALGNGMPIGGVMATEKIAAAFSPGTHGTTFGGNPVASAAAVATMGVMLSPGFLDEVLEKGIYFRKQLSAVQDRFPQYIETVRGMGLLVGAVLAEPLRARGGDIVASMLERGVIMNFAGGVALRFAPPLIVSREEIDRVVELLGEVLAEI